MKPPLPQLLLNQGWKPSNNNNIQQKTDKTNISMSLANYPFERWSFAMNFHDRPVTSAIIAFRYEHIIEKYPPSPFFDDKVTFLYYYHKGRWVFFSAQLYHDTRRDRVTNRISARHCMTYDHKLPTRKEYDKLVEPALTYDTLRSMNKNLPLLDAPTARVALKYLLSVEAYKVDNKVAHLTKKFTDEIKTTQSVKTRLNKLIENL